MERQRNGQGVAIIALAVALVVMTVGFAAAAYNQTLDVSGTTNVGTARWDVHFNTESYAESQSSVNAVSPTIAGTSVNYNVTLNNPGDFYEFTIDVENAGTFDAALKKVTLGGMSDDVDKYINYVVTYDGHEYTATNESVQGITLGKATSDTPTTKTLKVRVEYVMPDASTDLPTDGATLNLTASLYFEQV